MTIPRYKDKHDLTADEHLKHQHSGELPETDEYISARRKALLDADLEDDTRPSPTASGDMTAEEHFNRIKKT